MQEHFRALPVDCNALDMKQHDQQSCRASQAIENLEVLLAGCCLVGSAEDY